MGDELGDHRIVIDRDLATLEDARVVAHGNALDVLFRWRTIGDEATRGGQEVARRVFRIDAALDGPAPQFHIALLESQRLAGGNADHLFDKIDACDELRHRMLNLQACVHLEEEEALVLTGHEFHRAGAVVVHRLGKRDRLLAHPATGLLVQQR